jgi:8-oxo-dGTP pyrophosphatase MutT (NUDIX family)
MSLSAELRGRIAARLDPLHAWDAAGHIAHSDFDLSPQFRPAERPALRQAAVLVPIVDRPGGLGVLMTRRADTLTSHTGQVAFPGGRFEPGEGPVEAAVREAHEEIDLDPAFVEPLGLSDRYETVTGYVVTPVVALVRPGFTLKASPAEVAEVFEVPFAFLMDTANHKREFFERAGAKRWFYAMPWEGRNIWGATAGMVRALYLRLYGDPAVAEEISKETSRDMS